MAENGDLIEAAHENMNLGRLHESLQYQLQLQQNLIHLARHADDSMLLAPLTLAPRHEEQEPPSELVPEQESEVDDLVRERVERRERERGTTQQAEAHQRGARRARGDQ